LLGWRGEDNLVVDGSPDASTTVRFKPVAAASTPFAVDDLIKRYQESAAAGEHHPVLLSGLFILDLLVIHPFEDGNGRVARLLTGALLGAHGYIVGRYVSIEQAIAESADAYYQRSCALPRYYAPLLNAAERRSLNLMQPADMRLRGRTAVAMLE
jgi:Fic family protein